MGYVDGIINAQLNVYGYNFMEESFDEQFLEEFKKHIDWQVPPDYLDDARSVIADYYLTHDDERMEIAANGQKKVLEHHTYDIRVRQMLDMVKEAQYLK